MGKPRGIEDDIRDLWAQGNTYTQIIELLGCSKSTISYHVGKGNEKERVQNNTRGNRKLIRDHIIELKRVTPCADCDRIYPYYVTQYDHLPQFVKCFNISQFHRFTLDLQVVLAEVAKCELVCANCHAARGHERRVETKQRKAIYHDILDNDDWDYDEDDIDDLDL